MGEGEEYKKNMSYTKDIACTCVIGAGLGLLVLKCVFDDSVMDLSMLTASTSMILVASRMPYIFPDSFYDYFVKK
ncbi:hypothetical protein KAI32_04250 [Candidatus Pacearchaeota archaeon]|nr:hypothetical protein [Candidatus Pacearchaeota archaeon]